MEFRWGVPGWNCALSLKNIIPGWSRREEPPKRGVCAGQDIPGISHNPGEAEECKNTVKADNTSGGKAIKTP